MSDISLKFIEDAANHAEKKGLEWVQLNQAARRLEEGQRTLLSKIKNNIAKEYYNRGNKIVESQLERLAMAHPDYISYLEAYVEAEADALGAKIIYETAKNKFEGLRTYISYEKAKINLV